jgi:peptidoglycan/LPS O-acetylase OafA/YrhL
VIQSPTKIQSQEYKIALWRLPSLDGWRAISILLVLGNHCTFVSGFPKGLKSFFRWIFDGDLGVRFFFVISGFLITWLMLQEMEQTSAVSLRNFYARRCLRILPVYFTFLGVLAVLQFLHLNGQSTLSWIGSLTFTRNLLGEDPVTAHLWSLSVEEQFYLVWPGIFLLLGGGRNLRTIISFLFLSILTAPALRGLIPFSPNSFCPLIFQPLFYKYSFALRFDSLAFACACAILLAHKHEIVEEKLKVKPWLTASAAIMLIIVPEELFMFFPSATIGIEIKTTLQALGFSILLLHSTLAPHWNFYRALNWKWIRQIGILSYSIYIWQQFFWRTPSFFNLNRIWWMGIWLIPLSLTVIVSYYGLERPLLKLRDRYRKMHLIEPVNSSVDATLNPAAGHPTIPFPSPCRQAPSISRPQDGCAIDNSKPHD